MSAAGGGGSAGLTVVKGHGTENDFVLVVDLDGTVDLNPRLVRALCDRRAGVGGDGVLRVVRTERLVGGTTVAPGTEFFMDYRNADGSIAEMCGNGLRVFVRYLFQSGMITGTTAVIGTRAGALPTTVEPDGRITVVLGLPGWPSARPSVRVAGLAAAHPCVAVTMPNPHLVVELVSRAELDALDLSHPPHVDPPLPDGQNVEFVVREGPRALRMRVHERGVGETRSCGTGLAAVVAAASVGGNGAGSMSGDGAPWRVTVPGGVCTVRWRPDGHVELTGPAVIVGTIELDAGWLATAGAA